MRIAITSQNFRTVTGHAGRARRFIIVDTQSGTTPVEAGRLDLPPEFAIHDFDHLQAHPLDDVDVLLTGGAGEGFVRRMAARGVRVVRTGESDPALAVADFLAGRIKPPVPEDDPQEGQDDGCACACATDRAQR